MHVSHYLSYAGSSTKTHGLLARLDNGLIVHVLKGEREWFDRNPDADRIGPVVALDDQGYEWAVKQATVTGAGYLAGLLK